MTSLPSPTDPLQPLQLSQDQRVASAAGWLAVILNLGCQGLGYVYQRRWGAFWIGGITAGTSAVVLGSGAAITTYAVAGANLENDPEEQAGVVGAAAILGAYTGVLAVGMGSALEAGLAVNRSRRRLAASGTQTL